MMNTLGKVEMAGFETRDVDAGEVTIRASVGGAGPPVLLLHGYPEMRLMWHAVAPRLAESFTVVAPDLRGYGDSSKPPSDDDHAAYSFRAMAADQVAVMMALGFDRFAVVGHDRGARVTHRMALDHPDRVTRIALLDIVPTLHFYDHVDQRTATAYYHWFFLIQPNGFPEKLLGTDPEWYIRGRCPKGTPDEIVDEYVRCFSDPACIHATCEDYRAGASIDLEHDRADAGRKVACPALVLWGERGLVGNAYDVMAVWETRLADARGQGIPCGHFIPEEAPEETVAALLPFLKAG